MRKLMIDIPEIEQQIEINGHIFDIKKNDMDILNKAAEIEAAYRNLKTVEEIKTAIYDIIGFIDEILGENSVKIISNGKPVGLIKMIEIMQIVTGAVVAEYNQKIADEYK